MQKAKTVVVDFVARGDRPDEWKMVLVEEGPWRGPVDDHLRRIQARLYDCLDVAIDGKLAEQFPESAGGRIVIRLDCYNVPEEAVSEFFDRFAAGVLQTPQYANALKKSSFVSSVEFEVDFVSIH